MTRRTEDRGDHWNFQDALPWLGPAIIGRMMYVARLVQRGRRKLVSVETALEIPIAAGCGIIAYGVTWYWGLTGPSAAAGCAVFGYLGPRIIDTVVSRLIEKYLGKLED